MKKKGIIALALTAAQQAAQMRLLRQQKHPKQQVQRQQEAKQQFQVRHEWLNWD